MPFGLDLKSVIVGVVFALFVWPFLMQLIGKMTSGNAAPKKA